MGLETEARSTVGCSEHGTHPIRPQLSQMAMLAGALGALKPRLFGYNVNFLQNKQNLEKLGLLSKLLEAGKKESWRDKAPSLTEGSGDDLN